MKIRLQFKPCDLWIGFYWDRSVRTLYFCPIPMVCLSFRFAIPGFIRDTEELREVFGEPDRKIQVPVNVREVDHSE